MNYLSLGLRAVLTLVFIGAGGAKLAGAPVMVEGFETIGFGLGFMYFTGIVEVVGTALLWWPNRQAFGAALLGATMVGATLTNIFIMGTSAALAIILGLMSAAVLYLYRDQVAAILGRSQTA